MEPLLLRLQGDGSDGRSHDEHVCCAAAAKRLQKVLRGHVAGGRGAVEPADLAELRRDFGAFVHGEDAEVALAAVVPDARLKVADVLGESLCFGGRGNAALLEARVDDRHHRLVARGF